MASATADTNIYVSAYNFGGVPRRFIDLAAHGAFRLDISDVIVVETLEVLRDKFQWEEDALQELEKDISSFTHRVTPNETLSIILEDPDDDRILECAVEANSDCIVSGDKHLLRMKQYGSRPIMKVADFLQTMLRPSPSPPQ